MKQSIIVVGLILLSLSFASAQLSSNCSSGIYRDLSFGSRDGRSDSDVSTLQEFLINNSYLNTSVTGYFGSATRQAVKNFQRDNGLSPVGIVGQYTRSLIDDTLCAVSDGNNYSDTSSQSSSEISIPTTYINQPDPQTSSNPIYTQTQNIQPYQAIQSNQGSYYTNNYQALSISPSLTINNPNSFSSFIEGGTVNVSWLAVNLNANSYQITLENTSTQQVSIIQNVSGSANSASFVLTKEILDLVCSSGCNTGSSYPQANFRINVIAYYNGANYTNSPTQLLKAYVGSISITRPYGITGGISITASKTPVNSNEMFNLYLTVNNSNIYPYTNTSSTGYFYNVKMICPTNVAITFNNMACGQMISGYQNNMYTMPNINITAINNSFNSQQVQFTVDVYNQAGGTLLGSATANVVVNKQ